MEHIIKPQIAPICYISGRVARPRTSREMPTNSILQASWMRRQIQGMGIIDDDFFQQQSL